MPIGCAQVCARQVLENLLEGDEKKTLVFFDRAAEIAAELLAVKILERFAVGGIRRQPFESLEVKQAAVNVIGAGLW